MKTNIITTNKNMAPQRAPTVVAGINVSIQKSIEWLLNNASLPVQYLARKNILGQNPDSRFMRDLWSRVNQSKEVRHIFDMQKRNGSWCIGGPSSGYDPSQPKYKTTVWMLPILAEIGFTVKDQRIKKACDYILNSWVFESPIFKKPISKTNYSNRLHFNQCRFTWYLIALASVGCADNPFAKKGFAMLLHRQRKDGGWVMPGHIETRKGRSCPWSSYGSAMALYYAKNKTYTKALLKAFGFIVTHLSSKNDRDILKIYFRGHNLIRELLVLTELGIGLKANPIKSLLAWLMSMYNKNDGSFTYSGKPASKWIPSVDGASSTIAKYHFNHIVEKDWLTYQMTRIILNLKKGRENAL